MNQYPKTLSLLFALTALIMTAPAFAQTNNTYDPKKHDIPKAIPPAQTFGANESQSFYVSGDYTLWVPYCNKTEIAVGIGTDTIVSSRIAAKTYAVSGFKAGFGGSAFHDGWHYGVNYTWFSFNPTIKSSKNINSEILYHLPNDGRHLLTSLSSKYNVQFNRVDGMINRTYYIGDYVTFRPWLGLLGAWDTQYIYYEGIRNADPAIAEIGQTKQEWWGLGPYSGGEATYYMTNNFGLFISSGMAILLGHHTTYPFYTNTDLTTNAVTILQNGKYPHQDLEPMLEVSLGIHWEKFWDGATLSLNVAWETQVYFAHVDLPNPHNIGRGDKDIFSMQGLTAGLRLSF